jgi:hypothetical protein
MRRLIKARYDQDNFQKVFNMGFHPSMLYFFPTGWLYSLPFNFLVDSIVLLIGFKIFGKEKVGYNWKKSILKSWIFGYISDVAAALLMLLAEFIAGEAFHTSVMANPFGGIFPFAATLISVIVAGVLIFVFNYKIALNRTELDQKARKKVALLMAIATAPYPFFIPVVF